MCCSLLCVSLTTTYVAPFTPCTWNQIDPWGLIKPVAQRYWCPLALPLWLLSFLVPGTKSATQVFPSVLLSLICMLDYYLTGIFHSLCQEPNVSPRCYKACCPVLLVVLYPCHSGCLHSWYQEWNVPHSYSLWWCSLLCVSLTTTYVAPFTPCTWNQM